MFHFQNPVISANKSENKTYQIENYRANAVRLGFWGGF